MDADVSGPASGFWTGVGEAVGGAVTGAAVAVATVIWRRLTQPDKRKAFQFLFRMAMVVMAGGTAGLTALYYCDDSATVSLRAAMTLETLSLVGLIFVGDPAHPRRRWQRLPILGLGVGSAAFGVGGLGGIGSPNALATNLLVIGDTIAMTSLITLALLRTKRWSVRALVFGSSAIAALLVSVSDAVWGASDLAASLPLGVAGVVAAVGTGMAAVAVIWRLLLGDFGEPDDPRLSNVILFKPRLAPRRDPAAA